MVFKELEIQGFKSFPDKVKITFDAGVTGVVGPNGSGKSNLSDAVRWVLGETSSRQLRAAGKMEDVIFGGTRRRSAMGFASVRLTLDNTGHTLDVDADEVTIGRKYYRSGDSEYTINGQVCRLRDVYELLLDTGIGRDGYSVIGQGRIAEIVAAKSSERREIFEEACGIAKYRYRKTEAERRLAAAGENLERLRDILGELESRVGPLEKESAKAQKFLELSEQRKTLEVTLWTDSVHRARDTVRQQVRDYETAQADYERFDGEAKAAEQEAEEIRMQAQQLTIAVERLNGDIRSITEQISGSDSRIAVLENDILRNEESIASLRSEIEAGEQDGAEADAALQRHRAVAAKMEAEGEKLAAEIDALNAELEQLADASNASGARKDTLRAEITDLTAKRTEAQVAQAAAEAAEETARQRLPALEQAVQEGTDQWETARQDLTDTIRYREMLTENEKQLANVRSGLELKLKNRKAALDEADTAEQRLGREPQRHGGGEHRSLPRPRGERAAPLLLDLASRRGALSNIDARLPKRFGAFVRERPLQSLGAAIRKPDAHGACRPLLVLTGKPVGTDVAIMRKIIQTAIPPGIRAPICPAQQHIGDSRDRERPRCRPDCRA